MSGHTILHVEDNEPNRMIVRDLLKRTSYQLIEAQDGTVTYTPRPGGGSVFTLRLPLIAAAGDT